MRRTPIGGALLRGASLGFALASATRRLAYDRGLLPEWSAGVPVVSVGALLAGGSGKTPVAVDLCRRIADWGGRPALVSRGYGGARDAVVRVVSDRMRILASVADVGDEALASARALLGSAAVVVGADRVAAAAAARDLLGARLIVADDAFQHRRLSRDLDLVILPEGDARRDGDLAPLPAGRLREPWVAAKRADLRLIPEPSQPGGESAPPDRCDGPWDPSTEVSFRLVPARLRPLGGGRTIELQSLRGAAVAPIAAIAHPERFEEDLRALGADPVARLVKGDHQHFRGAELAELIESARARGARCAITTTKDAEKLSLLGEELPATLPLWVLERDVRWDEATSKHLWQALRRLIV